MLWFGVYRWTNHAMVRSLPTDPAVLWFGVFRRILTHTPEACAQVSVVLPRDSDGDLDLSDPPVTRPSQQDPRRPRRRPGTGPSDKGMPCGPPRRRQPSLPLAGLPGRLLGSPPRRRLSAPQPDLPQAPEPPQRWCGRPRKRRGAPGPGTGGGRRPDERRRRTAPPDRPRPFRSLPGRAGRGIPAQDDKE